MSKQLAIFLKIKSEATFALPGITPTSKFWYRLPIDRIHDISVHCAIQISKITMCFIIKAVDVYTYDSQHETTEKCLFEKVVVLEDSPKLKDYENFVEKIFEIIKNCKFDKLRGRFKTENTTIDSSAFEALRELQHVKMTYDKCCVCHDFTETKTECGHHLCILCWGKISIHHCECEGNRDICNFDDDNCGMRLCPICRQAMEQES